MNTLQLRKELRKRVDDLSSTDVSVLVNLVVDKLKQSLIDDEPIEIRTFGRFSLREREARVVRNPSNGETTRMPTHKAIHFKPSRALRAKVNEINGT